MWLRPARQPPDLHVVVSTNRRSRRATYAAVCSKQATLLGNADRANRKLRCGRNRPSGWTLSVQVFGPGGTRSEYRSRIFWIDGRRTWAAAKAPQRKRPCRSRATARRSDPFLFRCAQPILRRIDHATRRWVGIGPRVLMGRAKRNAYVRHRSSAMTSDVDPVALAIFIPFFLLVTVMGFVAVRWRHPTTLVPPDEWRLGGLQIGTCSTWFRVGGNFYPAYTVIAVPALVYAAGAYAVYSRRFAHISRRLAAISARSRRTLSCEGG